MIRVVRESFSDEEKKEIYKRWVEYQKKHYKYDNPHHWKAFTDDTYRLWKHVLDKEETSKKTEAVGGNYYTYYFIGDLTGTRSFSEEDYEEPLIDREIISYENEIKDAIKEYDRGEPNLAKYFNDPDIKMDEIDIDVKYIDGKLRSYTKVITLEPLDTKDKIDKVRNWLTGQYSDGWGEGFEQHPVEMYDDQYEYQEEVEDEDGYVSYETNYDEQRVEVCIHFWNSNMAPLKFVRGEII